MSSTHVQLFCTVTDTVVKFRSPDDGWHKDVPRDAVERSAALSEVLLNAADGEAGEVSLRVPDGCIDDWMAFIYSYRADEELPALVKHLIVRSGISAALLGCDSSVFLAQSTEIVVV